MGLINRLIGNEDPKIGVHSWPKGYDMYERDRIALSTLLDAWDLVLATEPIAQVFPGTDKLGLSVDHAWNDGDAVHVITDGALPGGIDSETIYFVTQSNPPEGTVKLSPQPDGTPVLDILDTGSGAHVLELVDPDLIFWGQTRRGIQSNAGLKDQELRKRVWDEMAEGIGELAEETIAFVDEQTFKDELIFSANYLDAR